MRDIHYSDGRTVPSVIVIWDDLHNERSGFYRAFWAASPEGTQGSPVRGYCEALGSFRTIREAARDAVRLYPGEAIYRNGRALTMGGAK